MKVIENAVIVGRSIGDKLVYSVMDELTGKTISMVGNSNIEMLELGAEGMLTYENIDFAHMMSFETAMVEELV